MLKSLQLHSVLENLPATGHPGPTKERTDALNHINIKAFYNSKSINCTNDINISINTTNIKTLI